MSSQDILQWPDGFWCFREEFSPEFLRDDNYRVVETGSKDWLTIASSRPPSTFPS